MPSVDSDVVVCDLTENVFFLSTTSTFKLTSRKTKEETY